MSDKKISQLPASTTPLASTEEFALVQSGDTKKATIANVQAAPVAAGLANGVQHLNASKVPSTSANFLYAGGKLTIPDQLLVSTSQTMLGDNGVISGGAADANSTLSYFAGKSLFIKEGASTKATFSGGVFTLGTSSQTLGLPSTFRIYGTSAIASSQATAGIFSTEAAGVGVGPSIALGGKTNNSASPYPFAFIEGTKASASAGDYSGRLGFRTVPANGSSPVERLRIEAAGDVKVNTGNLVIGTSGKGIDFSADGSAAGMTSELLDDYEEGTWTPIVSPTSGAFGSAPTVEGVYTKIGNIVTLSFKFIINDNGTGSGVLRIDGLPFTFDINDLDFYVGAAARRQHSAGLYLAKYPGINALIYASASYAYVGVTGALYAGSITFRVL